MTKPATEIAFLEELRGIAQLGLNYAHDAYDKARYERLLVLSGIEYSRISGLEQADVLKKFRSELGHVTPKVGVNGAIFDAKGRILLGKRADDSKWELPGGWADLNESPRAALEREFQEELSIDIAAITLIDVLHRLPGDFNQPHTSYHLIFHCNHIGRELQRSPETLDYGYFSLDDPLDWHRDHQIMAQRARQFWSNIKGDH